MAIIIEMIATVIRFIQFENTKLASKLSHKSNVISDMKNIII